jgi:mannose-6-phosphate isomerase-like protein (cupin superfamily)
MAQPGDVLLHPRTGRRLIFRRTAAQTAGRLLEYAIYYRVREEQPIEHRHADLEQQVEVLEGALCASVAGQAQRLEPGDVLLLPAGVCHAVWNPADRPARAVWHTFPAGEMEATLEADWQRDGRRL